MCAPPLSSVVQICKVGTGMPYAQGRFLSFRRVKDLNDCCSFLRVMLKWLRGVLRREKCPLPRIQAKLSMLRSPRPPAVTRSLASRMKHLRMMIQVRGMIGSRCKLVILMCCCCLSSDVPDLNMELWSHTNFFFFTYIFVSRKSTKSGQSW